MKCRRQGTIRDEGKFVIKLRDETLPLLKISKKTLDSQKWHYRNEKLSPCYCLQCVMSSQSSCVIVCVSTSGQLSSGGFKRRKFRLFFMAEFYSFYKVGVKTILCV